MKTHKLLILAVFTMFSSLIGTLTYSPVVQAACDDNRFLTLPPWYRGLTKGADCTIDVNAVPGGSSQSDKLTIFIQILALNIVEILMHIVAYISIAFIIVGGFKYITSTGSPDGNVKGRQTIQNAIIGLIISIISIGIVNFVTGGMLGR